jgi:hypothetical protein
LFFLAVPSRRDRCERNHGTKDTKGHKVRKFAVAQNGQNRSRNDDRPERQANDAADRKRNQNGAHHLQSTGKSAPPTRVAPSSEIALRRGPADRVKEACAKEAGNEKPD